MLSVKKRLFGERTSQKFGEKFFSPRRAVQSVVFLSAAMLLGL